MPDLDLIKQEEQGVRDPPRAVRQGDDEEDSQDGSDGGDYEEAGEYEEIDGCVS